MTRPPTILVVDDEAPIRKLIESYVRNEGWNVLTVGTGADAVAMVRQHHPDLLVLDIAMPGIDGLETLRQVRGFSDLYVILLTARAEETDKLIGLAVGADDYLTKPFSPRELIARMKALLRRPRQAAEAEQSVIQVRELTVDVAQRTVVIGDSKKDLTTLEFDLLVALGEQPGRVFARRQLLERVWGFDYYGDERVVDVHIRNLRKALGDDASSPSWIGTVRGVGYRLIGGDL